MNKTLEEVRDWLLENRTDEWGDLDLIGLDFSDFDGDIFLSEMKVKGTLNIDYLDVKENLWQGSQKVGGSLSQSNSTIQGDYDCERIKVGGRIYAEEPTKLLKKVTKKELEEMGYTVDD